MHIEKNVCDNVLQTIMNEPGKSKDHLQVRKDLRERGFVQTRGWMSMIDFDRLNSP